MSLWFRKTLARYTSKLRKSGLDLKNQVTLMESPLFVDCLRLFDMIRFQIEYNFHPGELGFSLGVTMQIFSHMELKILPHSVPIQGDIAGEMWIGDLVQPCTLKLSYDPKACFSLNRRSSLPVDAVALVIWLSLIVWYFSMTRIQAFNILALGLQLRMWHRLIQGDLLFKTLYMVSMSMETFPFHLAVCRHGWFA